MRRLPVWLAGGQEVSELAYRIVVEAFGAGLEPNEAGPSPTKFPTISTGRIVSHLSERLDADEGDVLRAMAELERVGALEVQR